MAVGGTGAYNINEYIEDSTSSGVYFVSRPNGGAYGFYGVYPGSSELKYLFFLMSMEVKLERSYFPTSTVEFRPS